MPELKNVAVTTLSIDLQNYRTLRQPDEAAALAAMVATSRDRFWALTQSLLQDGYLPTDSILVLRSGRGRDRLVVKEGNRRIAAIKFILGLLDSDDVDVPEDISERIASLPDKWRVANASVPCTIYPQSDAAIVDRIVALTHGKGEKAGRDHWNAVARARHNRDLGKAEPGLDLLEKYLDQGRNVTSRHKGRWAGDYPITVLEDAMKRLASRLGAANAPAVATKYPNVKYRTPFEEIMHAIGQKELGFEIIRRQSTDFAAAYGFPAAVPPASDDDEKKASKKSSSNKTASATKAGGTGQPKAESIADPKSVNKRLKSFTPRGKLREKVVTLRDEAINLDLVETPLAFCFVLRSMFEISAKAYCIDHSSAGLTATKASGDDRALVDVLRDVTRHLTKSNVDRAMVKALHGAMTELGKPEGLLSVTSMNQLIHNPRFIVTPADVAVLFGNIFPLLEEMNS
jgi:hypothetical protein